MRKLVLLCGILSASLALLSQTNVNMGGSTTSITGCDFYIYDNGGPNGNYGANRYDVLTIYPSSGSGVISINFYEVNIDEGDTLFFFNGPSINYESTQTPPIPLIQVGSLSTNWVNNSNVVYGGGDESFFATIQNSSGAITLLFKSNSSDQKAGFKLKVSCVQACQRLVLQLDTLNSTPHPIYELAEDSSIIDDENPCSQTVLGATSQKWNYFNICPGVVPYFVADVQFLDNDFNYHQTIDSCYFEWRLGDLDTAGWGLTAISHEYTTIRGYNLSVTVKDHQNCASIGTASARIRMSNPEIIEEVQPLRSICMGDTLPISVGNRLSSSFRVKPWESTVSATLGRSAIEWIPDGPNCQALATCANGSYCASVTFDVFAPNAVIESAEDIISVCVNMEHSYSGDIDIFLRCSNGQETQLVARTGGSTFYGLSYDDAATDCIEHQQGIGWDYCWTQNDCISHFSDNVTNHSISGQYNMISNNYSATVWDSSWRYSDPPSHYYTPAQSFANLIGCPMNGTWSIRIKDNLGIDDGYVFNWSISLSDRLLAQNWSYSVSAEDIRVDGPGIYYISATQAMIIPIDTAGVLNYDVAIVDNLGCEYHNNTSVTVIPIPEPEIGEDISICTGDVVFLTASNVPDSTTFYWNNGRTTQTITALSSGEYIVEATVTHLDANYYHEFQCKGYDTIQINVYPTPFAEFSIEGADQCAPAELKLKNETTFALHPGTPVENVGATYQWYVWDEDWNLYLSSTLFEPEFILETAGSYHVLLYVYSADGCSDSLIKYGFIQVYDQPVVEFLATPESQMLSDGGIVYFHNFTDTLLLSNPNTTWYWDFGDGTTDSSAFSPEHTYETWGDYDIIFYVRTEHGCTDQIVHRITIEDNITFPNNIITPNGDGLNDVFVISGLNTYINADDPNKFRENTLTIYDRWGKKVYETKNYDTYLNTEGEVVVGKKAFGGEKCPDGTYYFTFYYKGKVKTFHLNGTLMIVRDNK
jgi:subtilisin-like proprotein convertase family protein